LKAGGVREARKSGSLGTSGWCFREAGFERAELRVAGKSGSQDFRMALQESRLREGMDFGKQGFQEDRT
jgi:hypothetical protein